MAGWISDGFTLWLTGLPCSGKTTLSEHIARRLRGRGLRVEVLDGDRVRTNLSRGLGFSKEDRDENVRRVGYVCNLLSKNGVVAIAALVSPYRSIRDEVRAATERFVEVHVDCPLEECMRRDVKGMYQKALAGEIRGFTGIDDPYEPPQSAEIVLSTARESPDESTARVLRSLEAGGFIALPRTR